VKTIINTFLPIVFARLGSQWLLAFCRHQKGEQGKKYGSNEEVIAETIAYFESIDKSFYKKVIEKLKNRWNDCSTLEEVYEEKVF